jgi:hypothetical protein
VKTPLKHVEAKQRLELSVDAFCVQYLGVVWALVPSPHSPPMFVFVNGFPCDWPLQACTPLPGVSGLQPPGLMDGTI